ncbi:hypothetical protein TTHERM_000106968 (macronuclear) [Tetrahymena thermophila SB210]|uniref:Uncharacterized protein n=1 Tax=Tetrahymena thermophila (strain SB210) TaxID=312017 RepID=W7XJD4_TETTS|nr:hypothetical protein TTHERM_000106968 [Tetrahymena thermophila SB210]EWS75426.1 hypothetical protein TTHERM_000106968 [Tetrahymena thermophila SB210]|eukprot:XP_012652100.1 hypothetical protein TTHERM_000106968 [Tetrahymena thermophila SB210]
MEKVGLQYKIECQNHKGNYLEAINIAQDLNGQHLKCIECIQDENISPNLFIPISKIEHCNEQTILSNWPPLNDGLIKRLSLQTREQNEQVNKVREQVIQFFKAFRQDFLDAISEKEKESLQILDKHYEKINKHIDTYNQISSKEDIKKILHQYEQNQVSSDQSLGKLISLKYQQKKENSQILDEALQDSALNLLVVNDISSFKLGVLKAIQNYNVVNSTKQVPQAEVPISTSKMNQHNQYSQNEKSQQQIKQQLQQKQSDLYSKNYSVSSIQKTNQYEQQGQLQNIQHEIQFNQSFKKNLLQDQFNQHNRILDNNSKNFHGVSNRKINFEMLSSRFEQSDQAVVWKNEKGQVVIKNLYQQCIQLYSDFLIEINQMYVIDIDIYNISESGEQYIGLIKESIKDEKHLNKSFACFLPTEDVWIDSFSSVISGHRIRHIQQEDPIQIQIQIYLKDRYVRFIDLVDPNNIIQIKSQNLDLSEHYKLSTHLCKQDDTIVVRQVQIVNSFDFAGKE